MTEDGLLARALHPPLSARRAGRRGGPLAGAAALLLAAGCAHGVPRSGTCTLPDADRWTEYRSKHFVIDVAEGFRDPAHLVRVFEELHAAVLAVLVNEPVEIPGLVRVVVLASRDEIGDLMGSPNIAGVFWVSDLGEPTIMVGGDDVDNLPQVVSHELTHLVSYHLFPRQPWWFAEGLAQFVEGVAKLDDRGRRWAGGDPVNGYYAGSLKLTKAAELLHGTGGGFGEDPYVASWILYRFLWNERSKQFSEFQHLLTEGEDPRVAWLAAFPEWDLATGTIAYLDGALQTYQSTGRGIRWEVKPGPIDASFTASPASTGDLHMLFLERRLLGTNQVLHDQVRGEVAREVLGEDPHHPGASALRAKLDRSDPLPALRAAVAGRPRDGHAWYLLGTAAKEPAEREAALRKAVALWPESPIAHVALARELVSAGRPREALPSANRAVDLAPGVPDAVAVLARVAMELGKCREGLLLQQRAVEAAEARGVGAQRADRRVLREELAQYRARCAASTSPAR